MGLALPWTLDPVLAPAWPLDPAWPLAPAWPLDPVWPLAPALVEDEHLRTAGRRCLVPAAHTCIHVCICAWENGICIVCEPLQVHIHMHENMHMHMRMGEWNGIYALCVSLTPLVPLVWDVHIGSGLKRGT